MALALVRSGGDWQSAPERLLTEELQMFVALLAVLLGVVVAYLAARLVRGVLVSVGVADAVEGTAFERAVNRFGFSTAGLLAFLSGLFVLLGAVLVALRVVGVLTTELFFERLTEYLPRLFVAALAVILGLVVGDKAKIETRERLRSVKAPETGVIPFVVKYSIFYVAALIALAQLGVATLALVVLLAAYVFGIVFIGGLAFRDLLAASAAGIYLLLHQPYGIGDEIRIDESRGIVQEVDVFVTRIENDGEEFIVPNHHVFRAGVVRVRE